MSTTLNNLRNISNFHTGGITNPFSNEPVRKTSYTPKKTYEHGKKTLEEDIIAMIEESNASEAYNYASSTIDSVFDDIMEEDENSSIKSNLISLGRKYARTHDDDGTTSEIDRAFSPQINKLNELLNSVTKDTVDVDKDLLELRMMRSGRNYQRMNELIATKAQLHNTNLSILKELSNIEKTKFDIKSRNAKSAGESQDPSVMSGNILQSIFGVGHDALLESVGGREGSSGAMDDTNTDSDDYGESIYSQNFPDLEEDESDGDKFLKYEGMGVEMVLEEHDDGTKQVYAEDAEGNIITDYPLPKDVNELTFDINRRTGVATDQLQRKYKYKSVE